jgi:RNA polymerase sigma-70 factor (ECF subfamily)
MNDSSEDYGDLLRRVGQGDAAARAELIERCQERLRIRVSQMLSRFPRVRRTEGTSDVLQEVLLDLSQSLLQIAPRDMRHFLGLAGQRIRWKLLDLARRPREIAAACAGPAEAEQTTYDPPKLAQWAEIHEYVQRLPDEERELFDLIFYQGVPQPLVAEMLHMPYRTLKRRWQEARLRFMERFGGEPFAAS